MNEPVEPPIIAPHEYGIRAAWRRERQVIRGRDPLRAFAERVECPWCGAKPGQPCFVRGSRRRLLNRESQWHASREAAAARSTS